MLKRILSLATGAALAERSQLSCEGVSSLNYAGADATAEAPAASWEEWQMWAARAPKGQRKERQEALKALTNEMLRREVGW